MMVFILTRAVKQNNGTFTTSIDGVYDTMKGAYDAQCLLNEKYNCPEMIKAGFRAKFVNHLGDLKVTKNGMTELFFSIVERTVIS
jgi:hypothetical protein